MEDLELYSSGKPTSNLNEVMAFDLFKGGAADLFLGDDHYRIENIWPVVNGTEAKFDGQGKSRVRWFVDGEWKPSPVRTFDTHISPKALMSAFHDNDKKLIFVVFAQAISNGKMARIVLYPRGRVPKRDDRQIVGWHDAVNPIMGGAQVRAAAN